MKNYKFGPLIQTGKFGKIFKAYDRLNNEQLYAIKVIEKKGEYHNKFDIEREIHFLNRLKGHPKIVRLFDVFEDEYKVYLVFEYLPTDLYEFNYRSQNKLELWLIKRYIKQLLEVVKHLHKHGIMHCDIKLENILLTSDYMNIKLCDLGHMIYFPDEVPLPGTSNHFPPEIILENEHKLNFKLDMWCIGIVIYELLCGERLWNNEEGKDLFTEIKEDEPDYPSNLDEDGKNLIQGLLIKEPDKRLNIDEALSHAFLKN